MNRNYHWARWEHSWENKMSYINQWIVQVEGTPPEVPWALIVGAAIVAGVVIYALKNE